MGSDQLRPARVPGDQLTEYGRAVNRHFYESEADEDVRPWVEAFDTGYRAWWVRAGDRVVANLGVIETDLSLPGGGRLPVAGITAVGVAQTMRRRGLLRTLMRAGLDEAQARGEPLAALFASESAIYGRFGFGPAVPHIAYRVDRARLRFLDPVDVRLVEQTTPEAAAASWPAIHERLREQRGGSIGVTAAMWRMAVLEDPPGWRDGATARQLVEVPGRGYARYRVKEGGDWTTADGTVALAELVATDPEAESALWQHVCDLDLTTRTTTWLRPPDDALPHLVADPLALGALAGPPMYVRVLDVERLLTSRSYATTGGVRLAVVDPDERAGGCWQLEVGPDGASCEATTADPHLVLPVDVLASVAFGGVRATTLRAARRLDERRAGAAAALDRLLAVDAAPWSTTEF